MNGFAAQPDPSFPDEKPASQGHVLEEPELHAALQLLVERAQFITGATGAALALPQGDKMVCRASAGSSAPPVGVSLQVRSGLTGESIAHRQLLRCDNAEVDPRVNLETCREMGIASIVVMPLLRRNGEVRGLFELFSDHAFAFEERDLAALQRMADLTLTALDLAERQLKDSPLGVRTPEVPATDEPSLEVGSAVTPLDASNSEADLNPHPHAPTVPVREPSPPALSGGGADPAGRGAVEEAPSEPVGAVVPEAMRRLQKCASCGFPVSEGRTLCLDCENNPDSSAHAAAPIPAEDVPAFLTSSPPPRESWLADHVNLLAIAVLILGILVAVVVFR
jgi:putative methionine-R-sulfoxide reductase with GAF domain